tara:strand:+ start:2762 stop:4156 length:1395 start_codon:yes stop_codon:yes gene_type:complete
LQRQPLITDFLNEPLQLCIEELPYPGQEWLENAPEPIQRLIHSPNATLLDSAGSLSPLGRFDILAAAPVCTLQAEGAHTRVNGTKFPAPLTTVLGQIYTKLQHNSHLPFTGGILGYLCYEYGKVLEQQISATNTDDIGLPLGEFGFYTWSFVVDHQAQQAFFCTWQCHKDQHYLSLFKSVDFRKPMVRQPFSYTSIWSSNLNQKEYLERISKIRESIRNGDVYQVNFAQRWSCQFQGNIWTEYLHLRRENTAPFSAFMNLRHHKILSFSPERFFQTSADGHVVTMPIKGTIRRHSDPTLDKKAKIALSTNSKDRAENLMIVDLLRNDLSRLASSHSVKVSKLFEVQSFPAVHHLVSTIEAQLPHNINSIDLLDKMFPGGSITGAPKIQAQKMIDQLEPHVRSIYCGSIIAIDFSGRTDSNIAIRTLVTKGEQAYVWAGGGIVWDSDGEAEYAETLSKVSKIISF